MMPALLAAAAAADMLIRCAAGQSPLRAAPSILAALFVAAAF